jgi:phospholipid-binding lipoprotein MlaA
MQMQRAGWKAVRNGLLGGLAVALLPMGAQAASEGDPLESVNRAVFSFNEVLDKYFLKPVAQGYQAITPDPVEESVHNVFRNLGEVRNLANNLLQGKVRDAGVDGSRFLFNSILGVGGLFDVATPMGLVRNDEDFGQTLGVWGVPSGAYLVLPALGPSSLRDGPARIPDGYTGPYAYMDHVPSRNLLRGVDVIDTRASFLDAERMIGGDKYVFLRNAYLQTREFKVRDGEVEDDF